MKTFIGALPLLLLVLAACAEEEVVRARDEASFNIVDVVLTEFRIDMPRQLPAGETRFLVQNTGRHKHNFEITGPGLDRAFAVALAPNQFASMSVRLEPGQYTVYCPVEDHDRRGMRLTITVTDQP